MNRIKYIVLDVDGTMTDGGVYINNEGIESKKFSIKDGAGILLAEKSGIEFIILTGRESLCVTKRAKELSIKYVFQNIHNKEAFLKEFMNENSIRKEEIAYIGDDLNDLFAMRLVSYSACPCDAAEEIKEHCNLVLSRKGGEGVIREMVEIILKETSKWESAIQKLFN